LTVQADKRSRGRPKLEDVAVIEGRLLAIALAEFLAHGYGGTSMARIVKAAGISKTTLYSRFASKEDLFRAIVEQQIERLSVAATLGSDAARPDLAAGLIAYAERTLAISLEGDLLEVNRLIYSESSRFPELGAAAAERSRMGIVQISDFIQLCAAADGVACRDPDGVAEAFIFMLRGWYVDVMLANRAVPATARRAWAERTVHVLLSARADW
jgi:TetR/AcrR family transcriptional repressor of mexJK operon